VGDAEDGFVIVGSISGSGMLQEVHYNYPGGWVIASATLKKISPGGCSAATVEGSYALFGEGTKSDLPNPVPVNHTGIVSFDGKGIVSGAYTASPGPGDPADPGYRSGAISMTRTLFGAIVSVRLIVRPSRPRGWVLPGRISVSSNRSAARPYRAGSSA